MGYTASEEALLTILLHAAKFPSCTVNGLLLGKGAGSDAQITHSIPLFHTVSLTLAPCVETALDQVDQLAQQRGLQLVGYYHCDSRLDAPSDLPPTGKRIADRVADRQPGACAVVLDNKLLADFVKSGADSPFALSLRDSATNGRGSWRKAAAGALAVAGGEAGLKALQARFLNAHTAGVHIQLADFDEHLDDASKDYANTQLLGASTRALVK